MLSSVAERVYWLGRYMERVENSARLMDVYSSMLFDLPRDSNIGWGILLDITGSNEKYDEKYNAITEPNVVRYLLADSENTSSIFGCLKMLRENARTTREVIPSEAWEQINELYLHTKEAIASSGISRRARRELFQVMITDCQRLGGLLSGCMAHNQAYVFIQLGRMLERADMTTRIIDVGSFSLLPAFAKFRKKSNFLEPFENVIWMNILRSLSGYQAYRQNVANRVGGEGVVRFMLQDDEFPRAVNYCLDEINRNLDHLPNHDDVQMAVVRVKRITSEANVFHLLEHGLLEFIDELQISIADVHDELSLTWFGPGEPDTEEVAPSQADASAPVLPLRRTGSQEQSSTKGGKTRAKAKSPAKKKTPTKKKTPARKKARSPAKPKTGSGQRQAKAAAKPKAPAKKKASTGKAKVKSKSRRSGDRNKSASAAKKAVKRK